MIYLDTSCLLKLILDEAESEDVRLAVNTADYIVISSLAELETEVQLKASMLGGEIRPAHWRHLQAIFVSMRNTAPFYFKPLPSTVFETALQQHRHAQARYCRSLDRLHLAAMEELGLATLMTLDGPQANAALGLGYKVIRPGMRQT